MTQTRDAHLLCSHCSLRYPGSKQECEQWSLVGSGSPKGAVIVDTASSRASSPPPESSLSNGTLSKGTHQHINKGV